MTKLSLGGDTQAVLQCGDTSVLLLLLQPGVVGRWQPWHWLRQRHINDTVTAPTATAEAPVSWPADRMRQTFNSNRLTFLLGKEGRGKIYLIFTLKCYKLIGIPLARSLVVILYIYNVTSRSSTNCQTDLGYTNASEN